MGVRQMLAYPRCGVTIGEAGECRGQPCGRVGAHSLGHRGITCSLRASERGLNIFQRQLELIGIELLGLAAKTVPLERFDDRLQPFDPRIGLALGIAEIGQYAGLLKDERAQRVNVIGKVRFHQHVLVESVRAYPVKRQSGAGSDGALHARGASPDPRAKHPVGRRSAASRPLGTGAIGPRLTQAFWPSGTGPFRPTRSA